MIRLICVFSFLFVRPAYAQAGGQTRCDPELFTYLHSRTYTSAEVWEEVLRVSQRPFTDSHPGSREVIARLNSAYPTLRLEDRDHSTAELIDACFTADLTVPEIAHYLDVSTVGVENYLLKDSPRIVQALSTLQEPLRTYAQQRRSADKGLTAPVDVSSALRTYAGMVVIPSVDRFFLQMMVLDQSITTILASQTPLAGITELIAATGGLLPHSKILFGVAGQGREEAGRIFSDKYQYAHQLFERIVAHQDFDTRTMRYTNPVIEKFNPFHIRFETPLSVIYRTLLRHMLVRHIVDFYFFPEIKHNPKGGAIEVDFLKWFGHQPGAMFPNRGKIYTEDGAPAGFGIFDGPEDFYMELVNEWRGSFDGPRNPYRFMAAIADFQGTYSREFHQWVRQEVLARTIALLVYRIMYGEPATLRDRDISLDNLFPHITKMYGWGDYAPTGKFAGRALFRDRTDFLMSLRVAWREFFADHERARLALRLYNFTAYKNMGEAVREARRRDGAEMYIHHLEIQIRSGDPPSKIQLIPENDFKKYGLPSKQKLLGIGIYAPGKANHAQAMFSSPAQFGEYVRNIWKQRHPKDAYTTILDNLYK